MIFADIYTFLFVKYTTEYDIANGNNRTRFHKRENHCN